MGVAAALQSWRPLLRDHGYLAFTELVWLEDNPPAEVADYFADAYPAMTTIPKINETIRREDFRVMGDFALPDSAWWDDYYTPLAVKLPALKQKYKDDAAALGVIADSETEVNIRRRFGPYYGYHFFVAQKSG